MRILIIGHVDYGTDNAAALRLMEVAKALIAMGHEVEVFQGMPATRQGKVAAIADYAILHSATPPTGRLRRFLVKLGVGFGLLHDQAIKKPWDVVYCYGSELSWVIGGWLIARRSGARLVADVTELYGLEGMIASLSHFRTRIGSWIGLFIVIPLLARNLAVPSEYFRRVMRPFHRSTILLPPFFGALPEARTKHKLHISELVLAYAGSPFNKEQLPLLFLSLLSLPEDLRRPIRFRFVGLDEAQIDGMLAECGAVALRQHPRIIIEALGRTDVATARRTVANADFVVVLRNDTFRVNCGFPSKVAEAYRLGTAPISNRYSDMGTYLKNACNGFLIETESVENVAWVLLHCTGLTPETMERIAEQALATGESYFSDHAVASRLERMLA